MDPLALRMWPWRVTSLRDGTSMVERDKHHLQTEYGMNKLLMIYKPNSSFKNNDPYINEQTLLSKHSETINLFKSSQRPTILKLVCPLAMSIWL